MEPVMGLFEILDCHPGVYLGGGEGVVAEQLLDDPDIGSVLQHMRGTGMAEDMAGNILFESGFFTATLDDLEYPLVVEHLSIAVENERAIVITCGKGGADKHLIPPDKITDPA